LHKKLMILVCKERIGGNGLGDAHALRVKYMIDTGRRFFSSSIHTCFFVCVTLLSASTLTKANDEGNDQISLNRSTLENIYICAAVAHKLNASDAGAQDIVIAGFEKAVPSIAAIGGELRAVAKRRLDAMTTTKDLHAFDHDYCERPAIIYMDDRPAS